MIIWRFIDRKIGHEKQSLGLLNALSKLIDIEIHSIDVSKSPSFWKQIGNHLMGEKFHLPNPDILLGAGHATHLPIAASRAIFGGKSIVLMKPSLPIALFDLVIVPQHDRYVPAINLIISSGVLGPIHAKPKESNTGMILLGGISRHFEWKNKLVLEQIDRIIGSSPSISWTICDSRRTPHSTQEALTKERNYDYKHWEQTNSEFLNEALAKTEFVWVTSDSASMLYEALSSGASVGVILLEKNKRSNKNKILKTIDMLKNEQRITLSTDSSLLNPPNDNAVPFNENQRIAQIVTAKLNIK